MARPRVPPAHRLGRESERAAARFLSGQGYRIEAANVRVSGGELDLVAREGAILCFVEVRGRSSEDWGGPLASIDAGKRRRFIKAVRAYLARRRTPDVQTRFDVVAVTWREGEPPAIELLRNAFDASGYF
jgi:putative endonuclease